jgi:hypothetical protein
MAYDFIVDHAQKNVWCTPGQNMETILQPARLTPLGGVWNSVVVQRSNITLPLQSVYFHVYQIGGINPELLGLYPVVGKWESFTNACNAENLIVDIYAATGVQMPRYSSWYMYTRDQNLIVAIQFQSTIAIDLDTDPIYLRFYKNAYYNSEAAVGKIAYVQVQGQTCATTTDVVAVQTAYLNIQSQITAGTLPGALYAFVNGYLVPTINLFTATAGSCVEFIYDSSIFNVINLPVADLATFTSTLDAELKYLLHYPGQGDSEIDYESNVDIFIYQPGTNNLWTGLYYVRNALDSIRMVTHKDYSIPTAYVAAYAAQQTGWVLNNLMVQLQIRKGGWNRPLVYENNRIEELYKLPDADLVQAMVGTNAVVPNWTAATLEASAYPQIMSSTLAGITNALVTEAYGYNALALILADTPSTTFTDSNQTVCDIPYGLQAAATAYEYDSTGLLLGCEWSALSDRSAECCTGGIDCG